MKVPVLALACFAVSALLPVYAEIVPYELQIRDIVVDQTSKSCFWFMCSDHNEEDELMIYIDGEKAWPNTDQGYASVSKNSHIPIGVTHDFSTSAEVELYDYDFWTMSDWLGGFKVDSSMLDYHPPGMPVAAEETVVDERRGSRYTVRYTVRDNTIILPKPEESKTKVGEAYAGSSSSSSSSEEGGVFGVIKSGVSSIRDGVSDIFDSSSSSSEEK